MEQEVTINGNSSIEVTLADESQKLSEVMVVGKSNAQILKESAFATSAFNIKPIVSSVHNINNVLGKTTGVKIREEGGVGSDFDLSINGMSGNSVRYFLDGIPLDTKGSGVNLANLPVNLIERVEIYNGVIPASLGADALGGAINIVTNRQKKNFLDFSYGYGSFNTHKGELFAQVVTPKTGIMIKPVVSANYSANNYVMKGVEVPNEEIPDLKQVILRDSTMIIFHFTVNLRLGLPTRNGQMPFLLEVHSPKWTRSCRPVQFRQKFMEWQKGILSQRVFLQYITKRVLLRKTLHSVLPLPIPGTIQGQ